MRIRYDEQSDTLYIRLREEEYYESDEIQEGLILDYDQKGKLIGVEILEASNYLKSEELSTVRFDVDKVLGD
jgi:uncharacterized protein YuzE